MEMRSSSLSRTLGVLILGCAGLAAHAQGGDQGLEDVLIQAQTVLAEGRDGEALTLLDQAIRRAPDEADLYLLRSRVHDQSGKLKLALEDADHYIQLRPQCPLGYVTRSRVHASMQDEGGALTDANKAIEVAPNSPDGYYRRADVYSQLGRTAKAKADEVRAEELDRLAQ